MSIGGIRERWKVTGRTAFFFWSVQPTRSNLTFPLVLRVDATLWPASVTVQEGIFSFENTIKSVWLFCGFLLLSQLQEREWAIGLTECSFNPVLESNASTLDSLSHSGLWWQFHSKELSRSFLTFWVVLFENWKLSQHAKTRQRNLIHFMFMQN